MSVPEIKLDDDKKSQVVLSKMLKELNNPFVTRKIMKTYFLAKEHLAKLKTYIRSNDVEFYDRMLEMLRNNFMDGVKAWPEEWMPKDVYTHFRCVMAGLFREAKQEIIEDLKENVRRTQKGLQPL